MADLIVDSVSSSNTSPFSFLNKLPTKRIDAAISAAAETSIPEQGEQTGGYTPTYTHLSHLPLFPLYSQAQHDILAKHQALKERKVKEMDANDPDKLLSGSQKGFLSVMGVLSGGAGIVSAKRWERRLIGASVVTSNMMTKQNILIVFTRWIMPTTQGTPWFVDVLEQQVLESKSKKTSGSAVLLKVGLAPSGPKQDSKVTLKLLETDTKCVKSQKPWSTVLKSGPCEAVTFIGDDGKEVPMEIVARIQRACNVLESQEVRKRFDKQWVVPVLQ